MEDDGYAGYIWDRSTIKSAMIIGVIFIVAILTVMSSYEIHLNSLQRIALEDAASEILGTKVSIGGYYPQPHKNIIVITQLKVANPPGYMIVPKGTYNADTALTIGVIRMHAESLSSEKKIFDEVTVSDIAAYLTIKRAGSNMAELHAMAHPDAKIGGKVIIKDMTLKNIILRPRVEDPDRDYMPHDIESQHIRGIGVDENGIPDAQAITQIADMIYRAAFLKAARTDVMSEMSKKYLENIASVMNLGPDYVAIAKQGSDWGKWTDQSRINREDDSPDIRTRR